jgi:hypothetical protein
MSKCGACFRVEGCPGEIRIARGAATGSARRASSVTSRSPATKWSTEVQFVLDGAIPGLDKFPLHLRCFAAWEVERTEIDS